MAAVLPQHRARHLRPACRRDRAASGARRRHLVGADRQRQPAPHGAAGRPLAVAAAGARYGDRLPCRRRREGDCLRHPVCRARPPQVHGWRYRVDGRGIGRSARRLDPQGRQRGSRRRSVKRRADRRVPRPARESRCTRAQRAGAGDAVRGDAPARDAALPGAGAGVTRHRPHAVHPRSRWPHAPGRTGRAGRAAGHSVALTCHDHGRRRQHDARDRDGQRPVRGAGAVARAG